MPGRKEGASVTHALSARKPPDPGRAPGPDLGRTDSSKGSSFRPTEEQRGRAQGWKLKFRTVPAGTTGPLTCIAAPGLAIVKSMMNISITPSVIASAR